MKYLFLLLLLASCGGSGTEGGRLSIKFVRDHGQEILDAILAADLNQDGAISGDEWFLIGANAVDKALELSLREARDTQDA